MRPLFGIEQQVPADSKLLNDSRFYRFLPRDSGGVSWRRVSKPVWLLTDEGMVTAN